MEEIIEELLKNKEICKLLSEKMILDQKMKLIEKRMLALKKRVELLEKG